MRFSLRWILAGMLYVAIAAAAFSKAGRYEPLYANALWALTLLVVSYAAVAAYRATGDAKRRWTGFVIGAACLLAWQQPDPSGVPSARFAEEVYGYYDLPTDYYVHAANAVATLAFGLMGSLVGLMAFGAAMATNR